MKRHLLLPAALLAALIVSGPGCDSDTQAASPDTPAAAASAAPQKRAGIVLTGDPEQFVEWPAAAVRQGHIPVRIMSRFRDHWFDYRVQIGPLPRAYENNEAFREVAQEGQVTLALYDDQAFKLATITVFGFQMGWERQGADKRLYLTGSGRDVLSDDAETHGSKWNVDAALPYLSDKAVSILKG